MKNIIKKYYQKILSKNINLIILSALVTLIVSCGTLTGKTARKITLYSNQNVGYVNLNVDGEQYNNVILPFDVKVKGKNNPSNIVATTKDYQAKLNVNKKFSIGTALGNVVFGGIIGIAIDMSTGALMQPEQKQYYLNFMEGDYTIETPVEEPVVTEKATKSKKNLKVKGDGSTKLENTVIRWYIESTPRGADVFTRVISSTDEVKNSNQNYVGSTPYETTEAFDIKGLSLKNAGDVQIEVTCEKAGYITQKKRFNILQAIDQKEISTKFNLIKE